MFASVFMLDDINLSPYRGTEPQVCWACSQKGDKTPKPVRFFFKNALSYFEYVCKNCAGGDQPVAIGSAKLQRIAEETAEPTMRVQRNVEGLRQNAQRKRQETLDKVEEGIQTLLRENKRINFNTVAEAADVSKAFLYKEADLNERIQQLRLVTPNRSKRLKAVEVSDVETAVDQTLRDSPCEAPKDRFKALNAEVRELRRQNEVFGGEVLRARALDLQVAQLEAENAQLRAQLAQPQPPNDSRNCFSGFFRYHTRSGSSFIYWDCRTYKEAATLAMLNVYEEKYGLLECIDWESPDILAVCDRYRIDPTTPFSPQIVYDLLVTHYPKLKQDYEEYRANYHQNPNDSLLFDTVEILKDHALAIGQLLVRLKSQLRHHLDEQPHQP